MAAILSLAVTARNAMPEGGKLVLSAGTGCASNKLAHARASHADDTMVIIVVDAHGYGKVTQHPESIFSDVDIARDFVTSCGGRLDLCASFAERARVEILLPQAAREPRWLARS